MKTRAVTKSIASLGITPLRPGVAHVSVWRYGCAVIGTFAIALLRLGLTPWLGSRAPFGLFFLSVVFTSWFAGFIPGLVSIVLGVMVGLGFAVNKQGLSPAELVGLINFIITSILIIGLNEKQRRAKFLVEVNVQALHDKQILLEQTQAEIQALNTRLQRAMQETHHRVKNNLQVVSALAEMQLEPGVLTIPVSAVERISIHVRALATIHDLLTQEAKESQTADTLHARIIMDKLIPLIRATAGDRTLRYTAEDILLSAKHSTALALLVNELVTNALKHGKGTVKITLGVDTAVARLEVCDEGVGFPPDFHPQRAANTGLELIESVGRWDLGGTVSFENQEQGGARVVVTFPISNPTEKD